MVELVQRLPCRGYCNTVLAVWGKVLHKPKFQQSANNLYGIHEEPCKNSLLEKNMPYQYPSFTSSSKSDPVSSFIGGTVMPLKIVEFFESSSDSVLSDDVSKVIVDGFCVPKTSSSRLARWATSGEESAGAARLRTSRSPESRFRMAAKNEERIRKSRTL